jgi:type III secretory pathway lipoprotein EscJ
VSTAEKLLQESGVRAARAGRVFKGQAVILVDASEIVKARELLRAAGIRVRPDWAS